MLRAAALCAEGQCPDPHRPLSYAESKERNHAVLVDEVAYAAATTPAEKHKAILYSGPIPAPTSAEIAAALHTLHAAGVHPLRSDHMHAAYAAHVIAPG